MVSCRIFHWMMSVSRCVCTNIVFNREGTRCAVVTPKGFLLYELGDGQIRLIRQEDEMAGIVNVALLDDTALIATVGAPCGPDGFTRRIFQLHDLSTLVEGKMALIAEVHLPAPLLRIHLNLKHLALVYAKETSLYDLYSLTPVESPIETIGNKDGLGALSPVMGNGGSFFAVPDLSPEFVDAGTVLIFDAAEARQIGCCSGSGSRVVALEYCGNGTRLAVASNCGILIQVFTIPSPTKLYEFNRSVIFGAVLHSVAFTHSGNILAVASENGTVHLYSCPQIERAEGMAESSVPSQLFARGLDSVLLRVGQGGKKVCCFNSRAGILCVADCASTVLTEHNITGESTVTVLERLLIPH